MDIVIQEKFVEIWKQCFPKLIHIKVQRAIVCVCVCVCVCVHVSRCRHVLVNMFVFVVTIFVISLSDKCEMLICETIRTTKYIVLDFARY